MLIPVSAIAINPGRREVRPGDVKDLADSILEVGLINPIMVDQSYTLIAGLHRLEAMKLLGRTEIECTVSDLDGLQVALAEIDENFVRKDLSDDEFRELLLRRKEIYESLHPETKAGIAQAAGMNRAVGNNVADKMSATSKSFVDDTADKLGVDPRTVRRELQTAKNLTPEAKEIIKDAKVTKSDALKLSRLPPEQQAEAAVQLVESKNHSMEAGEPPPSRPKQEAPPPSVPYSFSGRHYASFEESKRISQYTCGQYSKTPVGVLCRTQHRINESVVLDLISGMLQAIADFAKSDRAAFIREVQEAQASQQDSDIKKKKRRLLAAQKRAGELERLVCKIYEDNALGQLPDARYAALDAQYAKEQEALAAEIAELEKAVSSYDQGKKSAEKFIALIDKYQGFEDMTNTMLNEFVEKILVHERDRKGSIETTQAVEVYFNFVGKYIPPAFREVTLTPEEQEALQKKEELKDKRHQAYLRRKASGWQRQYEERTKAAKKAKIDAQKAAIRQEDIERGVFSYVADLPRQEPRKATMQVRPTL